jgi:hypothetical protein
MVAAKSLGAGKLVAAFFLLLSGSAQAGGIITAGSSGTLYYGGSNLISNSGAGSTVFAPPSIPVSTAGTFRSVAAAVPAPAPPPAPAPTVTLPPVSTAVPTTSYDAFINFGVAPHLDQQLLTTGTAQSWTTSPSLVNAFGHTPSASELNNFEQAVLSNVQSTFAQSGLAITATLDPNAKADHMLSVVSGLSAQVSPDAVGVTNVGHNGFDFIDKLGYANSPDQLEWAVAHNVAHELMHAFGGEHHTTPGGNNLDAPVSDWSVLVDPNTKFSAASVAEMTTNIRNGGLVARYGTSGNEQLGLNFTADGQEITGQPVPEPATIALWGIAAGVAGLVRRSRSRRAA